MLTLLLIACASTQPAAVAESPSASSPSGTTVLASWNEGQISLSDMEEDARIQLSRMESEYLMNRYQTEVQIAEGMALEKMVEAEASAKGVDVEALLREEVESQISPPTKAEIRDFYEQNLARMNGRSFEEMEPTLYGVLLGESRDALLKSWLGNLKEKHGYRLTVPFPDLPRFPVSTDDDPFTGPADAPVTIVEFGEYQCPYCAKSKEITDQVLAAFPGKVRLVYRDFPLGFHSRAIPAAIAANCAGAQDKYFPMHDLILANQGDLADETFKSYATQLELDLTTWETCLTDPAQVEEIQKDMSDGEALGVTGTPGFFINGIFLGGALPFETFEIIINRELAAE
jgi:predicted DsbA family dithiol-disulfide isomerase